MAENVIPGACPENYTIVRVWTATDACGNVATAEQTVTVEDNTPPTLSAAPANVNVECGNIPTAPSIASFNATDDCSSVSVTPSIDSYTVDVCNGY